MTYYEALGINEDATQDQIKAAYRTSVKKYHPDINDAPNAAAVFRLVQEAYEILINPVRRKEYDEHILHGNTDVKYTDHADPNDEAYDCDYQNETMEERLRHLEEMIHAHGKQVELNQVHVKLRFLQHNLFVRILLTLSRIVLAPLIPVFVLILGIIRLLTAISHGLSWFLIIGSVILLGYMAIHDRFSYKGEWLFGLGVFGTAVVTFWLPHILDWLADKFECFTDFFKEFILN